MQYFEITILSSVPQYQNKICACNINTTNYFKLLQFIRRDQSEQIVLSLIDFYARIFVITIWLEYFRKNIEVKFDKFCTW